MGNACDGKRAYDSEAAAKVAARQPGMRGARAYRCYRCEQWHIGRRSRHENHGHKFVRMGGPGVPDAAAWEAIR